ncbi:MAG TPA: cytochrome c family protein [Beijerinckiaceae bacterium]|nr:cytochrome c family protein [Beijerinckiaceae bacterium]
MKARTIAAASLVFALATLPALADGDPEHGKTVFNLCAACHSPEEGVNKLGPSLFGVVGRPTGSEPGFHYSAALTNFKKTWTPELLNQWLQGPQKLVPGTVMFITVADDKNRADVIAYLQTLK